MNNIEFITNSTDWIKINNDTTYFVLNNLCLNNSWEDLENTNIIGISSNKSVKPIDTFKTYYNCEIFH